MNSPKEARHPRPPIAPAPDRDSAPYWQALAEDRFALQRCSECTALRWPPRAICNRCHSFENQWEEIPRNGKIVSWIRTEQVFSESLREVVPYFVVQVALDAQSDILMMGGWLAGRTPRAAEAVQMVLVQPDPEATTQLPFWKPAESD